GRDLRAAGDGGKMRVALGVGDLDEVDVGEPVGFLQDRAGDLNAVVTRERADNVDRRIVDGGKALAELGEDLVLDLLDQPHHHVVEDFDLVFADVLGVHEEEVGDALQDVGTARIGAGAKLGLEFVDQGSGMHRYCSIHKRLPVRAAPIRPYSDDLFNAG